MARRQWKVLPGGIIKRKRDLDRRDKPQWKAPKWYRNLLERQRRKEVKRLIHKAKFEKLPNRRRRDADYNWS